MSPRQTPTDPVSFVFSFEAVSMTYSVFHIEAEARDPQDWVSCLTWRGAKYTEYWTVWGWVMRIETIRKSTRCDKCYRSTAVICQRREVKGKGLESCSKDIDWG